MRENEWLFVPTADNTFPATQFTVSNQSKLLCVPAERASGPLSHACGLQMSDGGFQLRKIMTSVTYSRALARVCVTPSFRNSSPVTLRPRVAPALLAPFALIAWRQSGDFFFFFRYFRIFSAANCRERHSSRPRVCTQVYDRAMVLHRHDSHSPSFSVHK